jgi:hypothetical protein
MIRGNFTIFSSIGDIVEREYNTYWFKDGRVIVETELTAAQRISDYWKNLNINFSVSNLQNESFQNEHPWSAAYISFIMSTMDPSFPKRSSHREYAKVGLDNRNNSRSGYKLFSLSRERDKILCELGDILIIPRIGGFNNSHGDVVYKIEGNTAFLAGGNLSKGTNKINMTITLRDDKTYTENPNGYLVVLKKYDSNNVSLDAITLSLGDKSNEKAKIDDISLRIQKLGGLG